MSNPLSKADDQEALDKVWYRPPEVRLPSRDAQRQRLTSRGFQSFSFSRLLKFTMKKGCCSDDASALPAQQRSPAG